MFRVSPSTRSYLSAWLETSMTIWARPEATVLERWRHKSGDSGVVLQLSNSSMPSSVSMEPRIEVLTWAASIMACSIYEVVVLPLVPVMPTMFNAALGSP